MNIILDNGAFKPEFAHKTDAGADLRSPVYAVVPARGNTVIDTGVHVEIPEGYVGILKSKSGLNVKHDLIGTGTIDSGYSGSIRVISTHVPARGTTAILTNFSLKFLFHSAKFISV